MIEANKLDAELRDLWIRRRDLDEAGWTRLYEIVVNVLRKCSTRGLPEDKMVYILEYFQDRVLRIDLLSRCDHAGALCVYYKRYLLDQIRIRKTRSEWEIADKHGPENDSPPSLDDSSEAKHAGNDPLAELEEGGFSPIEVAASAAEWLASNEEWVRLFVALSNCPDAELSEPLVHLAKRKGIKSQAYKAERLGFNWKGEDIAGFGETLIGSWIAKSLGIELRPENATLILGALKILCFEALSWVEQQDGAA
jgi:hypothetical protein